MSLPPFLVSTAIEVGTRMLNPASLLSPKTTGPLARMWGHGWFVLPNPVYGTGVRGTIDDVFPADRRWPDPQGGH